MQSIECRYNNDPQIRALVDTLVKAIDELQFTPSEIRECSMFAAVRYEQLSSYVDRPIFQSLASPHG